MSSETRGLMTRLEKLVLSAMASAVVGVHFIPTPDAGRIMEQLRNQSAEIRTLFNQAAQTTAAVAKIDVAIAVINNNRESDKNTLNDHEARLRAAGK